MALSPPKELYTAKSLFTLSGASFAVLALTGALSNSFGWQPRWLGLVFAEVLAFAGLSLLPKGDRRPALQLIVVAFCNGLLIYTQAAGFNSLNQGAAPTKTVKQATLVPVIDPLPWWPPADQKLAAEEMIKTAGGVAESMYEFIASHQGRENAMPADLDEKLNKWHWELIRASTNLAASYGEGTGFVVSPVPPMTPTPVPSPSVPPPVVSPSVATPPIQTPTAATPTITPAPVTPPVVKSPGPPESPSVILDTWNKDAVMNRPPKPAQFKIDRPYLISSIMNYHFNNGAGAKPPGGISLRNSDGRIFGPWPLDPNLMRERGIWMDWACSPNTVIPPGIYTVIDPDPVTWSQNAGSQNRGFTRVVGVKQP